MITFFDTETTGKANFRLPVDDESQPRLVSIAALLCEDDGTEVSSVSLIIRPEGFEIPAESTKVHGISHDFALKNGVPLGAALVIVRSFFDSSEIQVAHNSAFDSFVLDGEFARYGEEELAFNLFCTMKGSMYLCNIPNPYGYADPKWPTLADAYGFATLKILENNHDALADCRACKAVYFWIKSKEKDDGKAVIA